MLYILSTDYGCFNNQRIYVAVISVTDWEQLHTILKVRPIIFSIGNLLLWEMKKVFKLHFGRRRQCGGYENKWAFNILKDLQ